MRANTEAQQVPSSETVARAHLGRLIVALVATFLLLMVWRPTVLKAQSPADTVSRSHEVKVGETLWGIATRYYGDGHAWRALARRNGIPTTDDAVIRVGQVLVVPPKTAVAAASAAAAKLPAPKETEIPAVANAPAAPPDSAAQARIDAAKLAAAKAVTGAAKPATASTRSLAAQTTGKSDARSSNVAKAGQSTTRPPLAATAADENAAQDSSAMSGPGVLRPQVKTERLLVRETSRLSVIDAADLRASRKASEITTVFYRQVLGVEEAEAAARLALAPPPPSPRHGEYLAAPFPYEESRWLRSGAIVRRVDPAGPAPIGQPRLQLADEIEITVPDGAAPVVGDRYVAMKDAGVFGETSRIGVPAGIVQITRAVPGQPVRAYVRSQTGAIEIGQSLFLQEGSAARTDVAGIPQVTPDIDTYVSWIESGTLLPSLLTHVMLAASATDGVQAGDEFELIGESMAPGLSRIAVLRVIRVGALGSSAVVIRQSRQGIDVGVKARRIAKMP